MSAERLFITQEQEQQKEGLWTEVCSVDCTHPHAVTLTHHKGDKNPPGLKPADTSTGLVLNALRAAPDHPSKEWLSKRYVSTNHFDVDALTSVWAYLHRELALQYATVVEVVAHLGDFREGPLGELHDDEGSDADAALKVCCWINAAERERFSKPWEVKDAEEKFEWFLPRLQDVLADPDSGSPRPFDIQPTRAPFCAWGPGSPPPASLFPTDRLYRSHSLLKGHITGPLLQGPGLACCWVTSKVGNKAV